MVDGVCAIMWNLWGERNNRDFRGLEKELSDVWVFIKFHVSLWASTSFILFLNYSILLNWTPFLEQGSFFWGLGFLYPIFFHFFLSRKVAALLKKKKEKRKLVSPAPTTSPTPFL